MLSHITVGVRDLDRAARFYDPVLAAIGLTQRPVQADGGPPSLCWVAPDRPLPRFYAYLPYDRAPSTAGNGSMVAFLAPSTDAVELAYSLGLEHGGQDEGPPGPRPHYGPNYFSAYMRDPDGNKIHIVCRSDN